MFLLKIKKHFMDYLANYIKPQRSEYDFSKHEEVLKTSLKVNSMLVNLVGNEELNCISLGENCTTAWYLKQVGIKKYSYPFDWVFSSPEIVEHCIKDNFKSYLNKELIKPIDNGMAAGHFFYHNKMFSHRNPLATTNDSDYYVRCVDRFKQ